MSTVEHGQGQPEARSEPIHPPMVSSPMPMSPTTWPAVLGVIAIVFGVAGVLASAWGAIAPLVMRSWPSFGMNFDPMAALVQWRFWLIAQNVLSACIAITLIVGGIMLIKRRAMARSLLQTWAWTKILVVIAAAILGAQVSQAQLSHMQQAGAVPANMQQFIALMNWLGVALGVLWGWALPVFVLWWFARRRVREETASWPSQPVE